MNKFERKLASNKHLRVIGFDDSPFDKARGGAVNIAGIVCSDTRFEGMLWGEVTKDGTDATERIASMLLGSKFRQQIDILLTDGIAVGGFNIIRLRALYERFQFPCVAVMRRHPDLPSIEAALGHFEDGETRLKDIQETGDVHQVGGFTFQVAGCPPTVAAEALSRLTDTGHVPEALRLAHLIGAAVKTGESTKRA